MENIFTKHPHSVHEGYWEHFIVAVCSASRMFAAGCACIIHALFPFLFTRTASTMLFKLCDEMKARKKAAEEKDQVLKK